EYLAKASPHFGQLARSPVQQPERRMRVGDDGGERLRELVRDGPRELTKRRELRGAKQLALRLGEISGGSLLIGDVADDAEQFVRLAANEARLEVPHVSGWQRHRIFDEYWLFAIE